MKEKELMPLELEGHCYVLLQGDWIHPIAHCRHHLLWYPERGMTLLEEYLYRPYVQSIVTESPWLIGLYDCEKVFAVDEDGSWRRPNMQTYCASMDWIFNQLLHMRSSVSQMPLDGGRSMRKTIAEYKKRIDKANKLYKVTP